MSLRSIHIPSMWIDVPWCLIQGEQSLAYGFKQAVAQPVAVGWSGCWPQWIYQLVVQSTKKKGKKQLFWSRLSHTPSHTLFNIWLLDAQELHVKLQTPISFCLTTNASYSQFKEGQKTPSWWSLATGSRGARREQLWRPIWMEEGLGRTEHVLKSFWNQGLLVYMTGDVLGVLQTPVTLWWKAMESGETFCVWSIRSICRVDAVDRCIQQISAMFRFTFLNRILVCLYIV